jgi:hypothetical protein
MGTYEQIILIVLGGFLACAGSVLANFFNNQNLRKTESRNTKRVKLEEAYLLIIELNGWLEYCRKQAAFLKPENDPGCPIAKIEMLINCYYPKLSNEVQILSEKVREFNNQFIDFLMETAEANKRLPAPRFSELIEKPYKSVSLLSNELKKHIAEEIHKTL